MRERPIGWQHRIICKGAKNQVFYWKFTGLTPFMDRKAVVRRSLGENQVKRGIDTRNICEPFACDLMVNCPRC